MCVFHVSEIVLVVPNRAKHHNYTKLLQASPKSGFTANLEMYNLEYNSFNRSYAYDFVKNKNFIFGQLSCVIIDRTSS